MKVLCEKEYLYKIIEFVATLLMIILDIFFILNSKGQIVLLLISIVLTLLIIYMIYNIIYWFFQPRVLIYQYETGIIINRKIKIEYTSIESIKYKNHFEVKPRGNYSRDASSGIIIIKLKSGKIYKIRNVFYPIEAVDVLSKIKKQRKFR